MLFFSSLLNPISCASLIQVPHRGAALLIFLYKYAKLCSLRQSLSKKIKLSPNSRSNRRRSILRKCSGRVPIRNLDRVIPVARPTPTKLRNGFLTTTSAISTAVIAFRDLNILQHLQLSSSKDKVDDHLDSRDKKTPCVKFQQPR